LGGKDSYSILGAVAKQGQGGKRKQK